MKEHFIFALKLLKYKLFSKHGKGHGIHSPFLFDLITKVLNNRCRYYAFEIIENKRYELLLDKRRINILDFGAGSKRNKSHIQSISEITKHASVEKKYGELLFNLIQYFECQNILELGTSLGIGTLYLASARKSSTVSTIEGCPEKAQIAGEVFKELEMNNIHVINGQFDELLPKFLENAENLDFVFFDGNHRKEPTLKYFELCLERATNNSVFVFDDIHWSAEMEQAWIEISKHPRVRVTVDLFQFGIVFFRSELSRQNFVIRF